MEYPKGKSSSVSKPLYSVLLFHRAGAVSLNPSSLFAHFDLSVPGILVEGVSLIGEDEQGIRNTERVQSTLQQILFGNGDSHIVPARDDMRRGPHFVELE